MAIKILRLITGEDIIGDFSEEASNQVKLKKPFIIYPTSQPKPGEAIKFGMYTYIPYAETEEITFNNDKVITIVDPKQDLLASYTQSTSSIIQGPGLLKETKETTWDSTK